MMRIKYDAPKISQIIHSISLLTGITISFLDIEGKEIYVKHHNANDFCAAIQSENQNIKKCADSDRYILEKCKKSRSFEWHICHAGLFDAAMPVVKNGIIAGFVIMGRIRSEKTRKYFCDDEKLQKLYNEIPFFTSEQIEGIKVLLQEILFESAIIFDFDEVIDRISEFIENNLNNELSIDIICNKFNVSKNYLYNKFEKYYDKTVNEYITFCRIERSKKFLIETNDPIYVICDKVGIKNYTYFCKLFKNKTGVSPAKFRNLKREKQNKI